MAVKKEIIRRATHKIPEPNYEKFFLEGEMYSNIGEIPSSAKEFLASIPNSNRNPVIVLRGNKIVFMNSAALRQFPSIEYKGSSHDALAGLEVVLKKISLGGSFTDEVRLGNRVYQRTFSLNEGTISLFFIDATRTKAAELLSANNVLYPMNNPDPVFKVSFEPFKIVGVNRPAKKMFIGKRDNRAETPIFSDVFDKYASLQDSFEDVVRFSGKIYVRKGVKLKLHKSLIIYLTDITSLIEKIRYLE